MILRQSIVTATVILAAALAGCSDSDEGDASAASTGPFELPVDEAGGHSTVYLSTVVAAPDGDDLAEGAGEYVTITNNARIPIDMGGWAIENGDGDRAPLGIGTRVKQSAELEVHSGCGQDRPKAVFACLDEEFLDDQGDTLTLVDSSGESVATFAYGTASK